MEMPKRLSLNLCDVVQKHIALAFGGEHLKLTNCSPIHRGADLGDALARNTCAVTQDVHGTLRNIICSAVCLRVAIIWMCVVAHAACHREAVNGVPKIFTLSETYASSDTACDTMCHFSG